MNEAMQNEKDNEKEEIVRRLKTIDRVILVLSGKGGVGKSTVAVNIAAALAHAGKFVGLLDIDVHGPSVPRLLNLRGAQVVSDGVSISPVEYAPNLKVMSIGFMMKSDNDAVIWRGPLKYSIIKQFLSTVEWGTLDYLIVDSPPGTGDEPLSVAQLVSPQGEAVIVTTPQQVAIDDVRRSISFCAAVHLQVTGIIENMSGLICPHCGNHIPVFNTGGGSALARELNIPFLGGIPIDQTVCMSGDSGKPFATNIESAALPYFKEIIQKIENTRPNRIKMETLP